MKERLRWIAELFRETIYWRALVLRAKLEARETYKCQWHAANVIS